MDMTVFPHELGGTVEAIASKSVAHRALILAALCPSPSDIVCNATSKDIDATARVLTALGAKVMRTEAGFHVEPLQGTSATDNIRQGRKNAVLDCGESGSTLRFMLPVVAALGSGASFTGQGRLAERPLSPLYELLAAGGCTLSPQGTFPLTLSGKLKERSFRIPGDVSSQFVSGLLLASPLMAGPVRILVEEPVESRPYINLTIDTMQRFGIDVMSAPETAEDETRCLAIMASPASTPPTSPGTFVVEGDWSNAAFWLCAGALSEHPVSITGMDLASVQGDRNILGALALFGARISRKDSRVTIVHDRLDAISIDVHDIPDLVPALAAVACYAKGTTHLTNAGRLRLKESDRLKTCAAALNAMGAQVTIEDDSLAIEGTGSLSGGTVDAANDHRIAMAAAIAATKTDGPTKIVGAECVQKSYPAFFEDLSSLGGVVRKES